MAEDATTRDKTTPQRIPEEIAKDIAAEREGLP